MLARSRLWLGLVAASVALPVLPTLAAPPGVSAAAPGSQNRTLGPLISGTVSYVNGTYVWTDYAYDDKGANSDVLPGGETRYPASAAPGNVADLIQLQLGTTSSGQLRVGAVLETIVRPELPLVGVGFDTDDNVATGTSMIGGWTKDGPLGLEKLIVMSKQHTRVYTAVGGVWKHTSSAATSVHKPGNLMQATVALKPGRAMWRAVGVVGLTTQSWFDGSGPVYDLAFVRAEEPNIDPAYKVIDAVSQVKGQAQTGEGTSTEWQDKHQSRILAGQRPSNHASNRIEFSKVADRVTHLARPQGDWETFLYYSPINYGQGFQNPSSGKRFAGPFQPYGVQIPAEPKTNIPLLVFMHGANENHLQNRVAFERTPTGEPVQPGHFKVPAVVAFALGRDPSWGTGAAEQDVRDVIADVTKRFSIDRNRIMASGISAGGIGTFRMTELMPDVFAGGFSLVGADSTNLPGNLYNVPIRMQNGNADPLVNPAFWLPTVQSFMDRGDIDFRSFQNANRSHTHVPALGNCIFLDLIKRGRVINPARVLYGIDPENEVSEDSGLNIAHTGAYWVSGMALRNTEVIGSIDALSLGRAGRPRTGTQVTLPHNNAVQGEDYCGPNPEVRTGDTWTERSVTIVNGTSPKKNGLTVAMVNLHKAALDLTRMSLSTTKPLVVVATGDGTTRLRLVGPWGGNVALTRDGLPAGTLSPSGGAVVINRDFGGTHTYVLTPLA